MHSATQRVVNRMRGGRELVDCESKAIGTTTDEETETVKLVLASFVVLRISAEGWTA